MAGYDVNKLALNAVAGDRLLMLRDAMRAIVDFAEFVDRIPRAAGQVPDGLIGTYGFASDTEVADFRNALGDAMHLIRVCYGKAEQVGTSDHTVNMRKLTGVQGWPPIAG